MSNLTTNLNMLVPGNFKVTIDSNEFANLQFFCTTAEVPSIAQTATQQDFKNENAYFPGDTIEYSELNIEFIVDEDLRNYVEMYNWFKANRDSALKFKDITLSILSNKNITNRQVLFNNAFPVSLGQLSFTTQDTAVEYVTCTASFRYNKFEFIR
jgi:hypothetical protein